MKTLAIFMLLLLSGCSWVISDDDPPVEFVTEILEVKVSPNPVKLGEMVTFTCVVKDSTDPNLEFNWAVSGYQGVMKTLENTITVEARTLGANGGSIVIFDTDGDDNSVTTTFEYQVIE